MQNENVEQVRKKDNYIFKFIIVGETGVGKTCLLQRFIFGNCKIDTNYNKTRQRKFKTNNQC
jgi:GTPase SAR1 family protein